MAGYAGADEATSSLTNVSVWTSLEAAKQMDRFQPMLDLGKTFAEAGATFERPIMNYQSCGSCGARSPPNNGTPYLARASRRSRLPRECLLLRRAHPADDAVALGEAAKPATTSSCSASAYRVAARRSVRSHDLARA